MTTRQYFWALALAAVSFLAACSSEEDGPNGNSGAASMGSGGVGGSVACGADPMPCQNVGEDNLSCPDGVGPFMGTCAPKGACCQRSSNQAKIDQLCADDPMVLEYRVTSSVSVNHPKSTSLPILRMGAAERARTCAGDQCLLMRFVQPRAGGLPIAGAGKSTISIGRYNCDGTYSFYNDTVAPIRPAEGFTDPTRWNAVPVDTMVDPALSGPARSKVPWATNTNRRITTSPFYQSGTTVVDWELASSGLELLELDTSDAGRDCLGQWTGAMWTMPGRHQTFAPLAENNKDVIDSVMQNFCQLLSFSVLDPEDRDTDCLATPRCMPDTEGCKYIKLPDSLCPVDDAQRGIFGCHLGALGNPNAELGYPSDAEINCTPQAPTTPLDPDLNPNVSKGQCCDPLGAGTGGLPACNAFRLISEFAAVAVEITTEPSGETPPVCTGL
jgi:hypothetical protein